MNGDVGARCDLQDSRFDGFGEAVGLLESLLSIHQDVEIDEEDGSGVADADLVTVADSGDTLDYGQNAFLHAGGSGIEQGVHRPAAELDAHPDHDGGDAEGRDSVGSLESEAGEDEAADHDGGTPDIGLEVK